MRDDRWGPGPAHHMKSNRFTIACAVGVLLAAVTCLLVWAMLWRPLEVLRVPQWLYFSPMMAVLLGTAAYGLLAWARGAARRHSDAAGAALVILSAALLVEHLTLSSFGIERGLFGGATRTLLAGSFPGRPG